MNFFQKNEGIFFQKNEGIFLLTEWFSIPDLEECKKKGIGSCTSKKHELNACLINNVTNPYIKKIYLFIVETDHNAYTFNFDKVNLVLVKERPTYETFINFCNTNLMGDLCCIANTDISFDSSIKIAIDFYNNDSDNLNSVNTCLALGRHELSGKLHNVPFAQDAWIFKSPIDVCKEMNFTLGKPGCDNKIAYLFYKLGYVVKNPCKQIKILHNHSDPSRNNVETIPGPYYFVKTSDDITKDPEFEIIYDLSSYHFVQDS